MNGEPRTRDPRDWHPAWPNCGTPDCPNKTCRWSLLPLVCFPCGSLILGRGVMIIRYNLTHDPWDAEELMGEE